jgi:hypothetical protein
MERDPQDVGGRSGKENCCGQNRSASDTDAYIDWTLSGSQGVPDALSVVGLALPHGLRFGIGDRFPSEAT